MSNGAGSGSPQECYAFFGSSHDTSAGWSWGLGFERPQNLEATQLVVVAARGQSNEIIASLLEDIIATNSLEQATIVREGKIGIFNNCKLSASDLESALGELIKVLRP